MATARGRPRRALAARRPARQAAWPLALALLGAGAAAAQTGPSLTGSLEVRYAAAVGYGSPPPTDVAANPPPQGTMLLGAHADLTATWRPLRATVRLDPAMLVPPGAGRPIWEPGLSEAFLLLRDGPVDASLGLERLPLETARLTVPFQVEPLAADGTRRGLWGARLAAYLGAVRLRGAGFLVPSGQGGPGAGALGAALSVRLDLTAAQLEAHALYLTAPAFGLGASGTVGRTVLYGEAWLLGGPWRGRGALGASGYLGSTLWTLEAAYAPPLTSPRLTAAPRLAAQLDIPLADGNRIRALADVALVEDVGGSNARGLQASLSAMWETGDAEASLRLGPSLTVGESGIGLSLQARLDAATGF